MIDEVIVFTGSKRDFNSLLQERIDTDNDEVVSFMELIHIIMLEFIQQNLE